MINCNLHSHTNVILHRNRKNLILKNTWKPKRPRVAKRILKSKNILRSIINFDFTIIQSSSNKKQ